MLTKQELSNLVSKLPSNDAYGELIKDVASVYELMEEAMSDESRDIRNDKISITMADRTIDIPLYTAAAVNSLESMLEEIVREAVPNVAFETMEEVNERVRCDTEKMLAATIIRNHEVMSDDEFQDAYNVVRNIHMSRLLEAIANDDEAAISFYGIYENRYDFLHINAERGFLYEYFLKEDDINKWPTPTKFPISILDIEPVERAFYQEYIDSYIKNYDHCDDEQRFTERDAIEQHKENIL